VWRTTRSSRENVLQSATPSRIPRLAARLADARVFHMGDWVCLSSPSAVGADDRVRPGVDRQRGCACTRDLDPTVSISSLAADRVRQREPAGREQLDGGHRRARWQRTRHLGPDLPALGLSIKPRAGSLTVEYCPGCIARAPIPGQVVYLPLPSGEPHRDDPEPNAASATGDHWQDGIAEGRRQTHMAVAFATRMHAGQQRPDGTPFIRHPPEVATRLDLAGAPDHLIAAEYPISSNVSAWGLRQRFSPRITEPVLAVTDDEQIAA
jgi:hypothetical protein